jgi:hypothetical protein
MNTETKTEARERMSDETFRIRMVAPCPGIPMAWSAYEEMRAEAARARASEAAQAAALSALRAEHANTIADLAATQVRLSEALERARSAEAKHQNQQRRAELAEEALATARAEVSASAPFAIFDATTIAPMKQELASLRSQLAEAQREAPSLIEALHARLTKAGVLNPELGISDHIGIALGRMNRAESALAASEEKAREMRDALFEAKAFVLSTQTEGHAARWTPANRQAVLEQIRAALSSPATGTAPRCDDALDGVRCELDVGHTEDHQHSHGPTVGSVVKWNFAEMVRRDAEHAPWVGRRGAPGTASEEPKPACGHGDCKTDCGYGR